MLLIGFMCLDKIEYEGISCMIKKYFIYFKRNSVCLKLYILLYWFNIGRV